MCLVVPLQGEKELLDIISGASAAPAYRLRLYKNDYTPVDGSVIGDFTQADFSGYAQATPTFSAATTVNGRGTMTDSAARDFTHNGGATANTVYGYYVVNNTATKVLWAERFCTPLSVTINGDKITITIALSLGSAN